ncbi:NAD(P)/FAD-dependent oxidoreductase [Shewanella psychrotolerans]|uniref:NAD(P)/FAD-dependent oxidoreductase n=1 Tax=Shewanella psychrotolerans TaxID=2864206 RepID=UPI001C660E6E|nr:FAD-dependent oxidoreductase [Shewanella psychrotolerans]QYK00209.1 FAD-dependent oxidoreductase [Shewanella psychrotolerans]
MKRIAVIGSGISGLTCAYLLDKQYDVTVFEKNNYVGGHTATVDITHQNQTYAIDTGFIVFNDRTYPHFNRLLDMLGIVGQPTEMSFSVHNRQTGFEYNGHGINSLFAQRRNIFRPQFWGLIQQILKFNKLCKQAFHEKNIIAGHTLGDFLEEHGFSEFFCQHYILPMGAAIWSTSLAEMRQFELKFFIQFFYNHGLLNISDRPQWQVVPGGSRVYVDAILSQLSKPILTESNIDSVIRTDEGVVVKLANGDGLVFDEVIFACHSDQALALLGDATENEKAVLGGIPYSRNEVVLHTDISLLPKRPLAWASWNYMLDDNFSRPSCVTYNMNILQGIKSDTTFCVTLNQSDEIAPEKVLRSFVYHHPVLNDASVAAQKQRSLICGQRGTHFVGAYWYNGFHEDGVRSALDVTNRFGLTL